MKLTVDLTEEQWQATLLAISMMHYTARYGSPAAGYDERKADVLAVAWDTIAKAREAAKKENE